VVKEFPFNERRYVGDQWQEKPLEKYGNFMALWYETVHSSGISVISATIIEKCLK